MAAAKATADSDSAVTAPPARALHLCVSPVPSASVPPPPASVQHPPSTPQDRQPDEKRRSLADALAARLDGSAVHLDQAADDRQSEPKPVVLPRGGGVG